MPHSPPQMYTLCQLDYDLAVLDGAFLVHEPGIKRRSIMPPWRSAFG